MLDFRRKNRRNPRSCWFFGYATIKVHLRKNKNTRFLNVGSISKLCYFRKWWDFFGILSGLLTSWLNRCLRDVGGSRWSKRSREEGVHGHTRINFYIYIFGNPWLENPWLGPSKFRAAKFNSGIAETDGHIHYAWRNTVSNAYLVTDRSNISQF